MALPVNTIGKGKSFGSFGEIVQGRRPTGEDFLVTLPVNLWSESTIVCKRIDGPLIVESELEKSKALVSLLLEERGIREGFYLSIDVESKIPVGKGLSSSTADMLASLRAVEQVFGFNLSQHEISRLFTLVEPHDGLHYDNSAVYNHRRGYCIKEFSRIPEYRIVAVDKGGQVDTIEYNKSVAFTKEHLDQFETLLSDLIAAFERFDLKTIAECATRSTMIHVDRKGDKILARAVDKMTKHGALGTVTAHSGTVFGYLFPLEIEANRMREIGNEIGRDFQKEIFITETVRTKEPA